jgi:hypothetical protein
MVTTTVFVLSNDITPGLGLPVAAPGLRAFGIAEGLRSHGFEVTTIVPKHLVESLWNRPTPPPLQPSTLALNGADIADYVEAHAPATVITTNSNQVAHLRRSPDVRHVLDFFAPKMLELAYQFGEDHPERSLRSLRGRKLEMFALADAVAVNGAKKIPYVLGWLLQGDRDPRGFPVDVVNMAVPGIDHAGTREGPLRLAIAGYLQGWSLPGEWMTVVREHVAASTDVVLDVLLPTHWGQRDDELTSPEIDELVALDRVTTHPVMRFGDFREFMAGVDVAIDLFDWSLEREYAMVTRTVVALACGVPVIHPPFTEVAPLIERHDAGWLLAADDLDGLRSLLAGLDRDEVAEKSANATALWRTTFDPEVAMEPLVRLIERAWQA